jgi:hypothetical protein
MRLTTATVPAAGASDPPVTHPATGIYCVQVADPVWVLATSADPAAGQAVATRRYSDGAAPQPPCPASTTARVTVSDEGGLADGPFNLLVRQ